MKSPKSMLLIKRIAGNQIFTKLIRNSISTYVVMLDPTQSITFDYFQLRYLRSSSFAQCVAGIDYFSERCQAVTSLFMICLEMS